MSDFIDSNPIDFYDPKSHHDRVLIVGEKKFYVVSGILILWSEYFRIMFNGEFEESEKKEIELEDIDPEVFNQFLYILYDSDSAKIEENTIIPLIDLCIRLFSQKPILFCTKTIELSELTNGVVLELLEKSSEYKIPELKGKIVKYLTDKEVLKKFDYQVMVDLINKHDIQDLKDWIGHYLANSITARNCNAWLDYGVLKSIPTLKTGAIEKIAYWDQSPAAIDDGKPKKIPEECIITLTECAFKHDIDNLKTILRKRIFHMVSETNSYGCQEGIRIPITINNFLDENMEQILALKNEIREFILTSTTRSVFQ